MTNRGFTLIEMMIVVAIVIILSVVAGGAYRKYLDNARKSEVYAMFAEIRAKEEAYRAEFSTYLSTTVAGAPNDTTFYPALTAAEPTAKVWAGAGEPTGWVALNITPGKSQLFCGYSLTAGAANAAPAGTYGAGAFANTTPSVPWWYAVGTCDNDGSPTVNAIFVTTSDKDTVWEQNVHN